MAAIKEFRAFCYQGLTSFSGFEHRQPAETAVYGDTPMLADAALTSGDGKEPDQQSEQDEGPEQSKQRVKRMEVEVRIPRETLPCGQHKTSFTRAHFFYSSAAAMDGLSDLLSHFPGPIPILPASPSMLAALWINHEGHGVSGKKKPLCSSTASRSGRMALPAGPSGHRGFRSGAALRAGRFPDRDRAASAELLHRMVRSRPWRS
jgi:hypothetical protein